MSRGIVTSGVVRAVDRERQAATCSFSEEVLRLFLDRQVADYGTLECSYVDVDAQRQVRALDQFRNVTFLQGKPAEDREAFRNLRRVLLGLSQPWPSDAERADAASPLVASLNAEQRRAVRLINSPQPPALT